MSKNTDAWKAWERTVAKDTGGKRRGPHTGSGEKGSGRNDIEGHDGVFSIECKYGAQLGYADALAAVNQAEEAATGPGELAFAALRRKGTPKSDAIVCIRYPHFLCWLRARGILSVDGDDDV
jgi:hypothetical protein